MLRAAFDLTPLSSVSDAAGDRQNNRIQIFRPERQFHLLSGSSSAGRAACTLTGTTSS